MATPKLRKLVSHRIKRGLSRKIGVKHLRKPRMRY
jgi:hypothetical protein